MKKRFLLILTAILLTVFSFSSCVEDEQDPDGGVHESEDNGGGTSTQAPPVTGKTPETDANGIVYTNYGTHYSVTAFKPVSQNPVELVIPATFNGLPVKSIGMRAFTLSAYEKNTVITKITVSEGITDIEASAFAECINMTEISLPSTVTSIDRNAFARCESLVSVTIPAGVTEIGVSIFEDCKKLEQINVAAGNPNFASADGDLYSKDMKTLIRYAPGKNATTYTVKAGVTTIATGCFQATRLTEVNLSAEICRIEAVAFENCANLTNVTVPSGVSNNWWFSNFKDAANGSPIPTGEMNNPSTLSIYLKSTYLRYYFNRTV